MRMVNLGSKVTRRRGTHLVGIVPNSDTNTSGNSHAGLDDGHVIYLLLFQVGIDGRELHSIIEFRHGNFKTECSDSLHVGLEFAWRNFTKGEVTLETDTMDGDTGRQEVLDKLDHGIDFGACREDIRWHHRKCKGEVVRTHLRTQGCSR